VFTAVMFSLQFALGQTAMAQSIRTCVRPDGNAWFLICRSLNALYGVLGGVPWNANRTRMGLRRSGTADRRHATETEPIALLAHFFCTSALVLALWLNLPYYESGIFSAEPDGFADRSAA
jgi:hypothetical protein